MISMQSTSMGMIPQGYRVNNFLTDTDAFYIINRRAKWYENVQRTPLTTKWKATLILVT